MSGKIGIYTRGLWRLRRDIETVTGMEPVRRWRSTRGLAAIAGWGFKPTARHARMMATRHGLPYFAIEDGFFRSRRPGPAQPSISYVCDPTGIYYDASQPSALERMVLDRMQNAEAAVRDAEPVIEAITVAGISKYTDFHTDARNRLFRLAERGAPVIVVDQTLGDAAVLGAGADRSTFLTMLIAAVAENPGNPILIKSHPETRLGRRSGYLDAALVRDAAAASPAVAEAVATGRLDWFTAAVAPRDLAEVAARLYVVSSLLGFEALIAGARVTSFGQGFYAGWHLTDHRAPPISRRGRAPLTCVVAAAYRDYSVYLSAATREASTVHDAIAQLCRL